MRDLRDAKWMYLKAGMFLAIGMVSAGMIIAENASWETCVLLGLVIWSFSRAYYFTFYVLERYVDSNFKFSGLWVAMRYVFCAKKVRKLR